MIQLIKQNLITIISGLVIIACVVFSFIFMGSDDVEKAMNEALQTSGATRIRGLISNAKNEEVIAAAEAETKRFQEEFAAAMEAAKEINAREPLMPGVFPDEPDAAVRTRFAQQYGKAVTKELMVQLSAGTLPTELEIQEEAQNVADLIAIEAERAAEETPVEEGGRQPAVAAAGPRGARSASFSPEGRGMRSPRGGGMMPSGNPRSGGMMPSGNLRGSMRGAVSPSARGAVTIPAGKEGEPKYNPVFRANVSKARSIRCYVDDPETTFHVSPIVGADTPPTPADMWYAQVGLWIQQDIVRAVKQLNDEAAAAAKDGEAYVEQMPVKRIMGIEVLGYDTGVVDPKTGAGGFIPFTRKSPAPGFDRNVGPSLSFTGRKANDQYDIVRFRIAMIVDQRKMLEVIDRLSRANFYQCTNVAYHAYDAAARAADEAQGYLYGTAPVGQLTLDFEGYLLRNAYVDLMPDDVKVALGIKKESDK
ncbi:MAG: hypothetical protein D6744_10930 [Planctomycetota bacterium]|nr:MAG: hypothetical protein D6744_10930 [Planctomycetota bacterium]